MTTMPMGGFGVPDLSSPGLDAALQQNAVAKPKGGMFGGGGKFGWKEAIAFGLAGLVARRNPALLQGLMGMMAQKQSDQSSEEQYQRRRNDGLEDWKAREQFKMEHPEAINNDTVADYNFWKQTLPPDKFNQWLESKINPPQLMNVPGVGIVQVPRMGGQAPQGPVGKLTPLDEGGPGLGAPGGFPRPY